MTFRAAEFGQNVADVPRLCLPTHRQCISPASSNIMVATRWVVGFRAVQFHTDNRQSDTGHARRATAHITRSSICHPIQKTFEFSTLTFVALSCLHSKHPMGKLCSVLGTLGSHRSTVDKSSATTISFIDDLSRDITRTISHSPRWIQQESTKTRVRPVAEYVRRRPQTAKIC